MGILMSTPSWFTMWFMGRDDPQMKLRFPLKLKQKIEEASYQNRRTQNAEVIARLEKSFAEDGLYIADSTNDNTDDTEIKIELISKITEIEQQLKSILERLDKIESGD